MYLLSTKSLQRGEKGALDPFVVGSAFGAALKNKGLAPLDWKSGRPQNADPTTTDPTPHSRPSEDYLQGTYSVSLKTVPPLQKPFEMICYQSTSCPLMSASKPLDSLRLRRRFLPLHRKIAIFTIACATAGCCFTPSCR